MIVILIIKIMMIIIDLVIGIHDMNEEKDNEINAIDHWHMVADCVKVNRIS